MRLFAGEIHNQKQLYFSSDTGEFGGTTDNLPYWKLGMINPVGTSTEKKTFIINLQSDADFPVPQNPPESGDYLKIDPANGTTIRKQMILQSQFGSITFKLPLNTFTPYTWAYPSTTGSSGQVLVNQGPGNPMILSLIHI